MKIFKKESNYRWYRRIIDSNFLEYCPYLMKSNSEARRKDFGRPNSENSPSPYPVPSS